MRSSVIQKVFGTPNRLAKLAGVVSAIGIFIAIFLVSFDVVMRFVFDRPTLWGNEVASYLLLLIGSLGVVYALLLDRHIRADILYIRLPRKVQAKTDLVTLSLALVFSVMGAWKSVLLTLQAFRGGWVHQPLYLVPVGLTYAIVTLAFILLCLELLSKLYERFLIAAGANNEPSSDVKEK